MGNLRFEALKNIHNTKPVQAEPSKQFSLIFGQDVFTNAVLQTYLTKKEIEELELNSNKNTPINKELANKVATAMKDWALSKGATHYTHWFQPLNGASAEKHEAFFSLNETGEGIELFNGSKLAQQEPDASSFPHGGIRNTFEARGFSAWDPSSPAFMVGNTLCIPSIFVSYNGEALDYKTPLLRSCLALEKAATQMTKLFNRSVGKVYPTLGWEQEYFLIDNSLFSTRPDLILTGRTLFGHSTAKEQQLDDHYFGSISDRVLNFLKELEATCMKLAIPITTRHNEVAQGQYELAPIYDEVNISVDRNALLMDIMKKTALKHGFRVILHEKPFQGMNGSGKHSNWSLETNEKENLLSPGSTPKKNIQFLSFFINIIKAVHDHGELIQAAVSSASNDLRIGKQEAPPSIMSVYIRKPSN